MDSFAKDVFVISRMDIPVRCRYLLRTKMSVLLLKTKMKKVILSSLLSIFLLLCLSQCQMDNQSTERAIYYWQTTMDFDKVDDSIANNLNLSTLYIRYFDIDWDAGYNAGVPIGVLNKDMIEENLTVLGDRNIIPTIFITNRTFKNMNVRDIDKLAKNTVRKIENINQQLKVWQINSILYETDKSSWEEYFEIEKNFDFDTLITEIQIDCDWTASTRDKFFEFLEKLQSNIGDKPLSCTIRLHQYRDRKLMGIPPVNRGLLMCYNVAEVQKYDTKNAVLDTEVVKQYLIDKPYPIKLDIGLPMFGWAAWYRGTEFKGIVSGWNEQDAADKLLYRNTKENYYLISTDTVIGTHYLREGDLLRWDNSSEKELNNTIDILTKKLNLSGIRITFFDWETEKIKRHENELETYYRRFE